MSLCKLKKWKANNKKIALYCAGLHGRELKKILDYCGIEADCFLDNDTKKNRKVIDGLTCYAPEYISYNPEYISIICVGIELYSQMHEKAVKQHIINILDFRLVLDEVIKDKEILAGILNMRFQANPADLFYTNIKSDNHKGIDRVSLEGERVAIYTASFGNYDDLHIPEIQPDNVDYYYISDRKPEQTGIFKWINAGNIISDRIESPIKRNRYLKMHPDVIFPEYKYSIYIDSNIQIKRDITPFICISNSGISVFKHLRRDCLYYEAMTIVNYRRVVPEDVIHQMWKYLDEGMPLHFGLTEMPVIAREHNNPLCKKIMETWWNEFDNESQRDQLSFMYAVWKNGMTIADLAILGNDVRNNESLIFNEHISDSINVRNERI